MVLPERASQSVTDFKNVSKSVYINFASLHKFLQNSLKFFHFRRNFSPDFDQMKKTVTCPILDLTGN